MTTKAERDEIIHEPWRARMENDLALQHTPDPSVRLAIAAEYAAFQLVRWPRLLGQIFRFDKWIVCRG